MHWRLKCWCYTGLRRVAAEPGDDLTYRVRPSIDACCIDQPPLDHIGRTGCEDASPGSHRAAYRSSGASDRPYPRLYVPYLLRHSLGSGHPSAECLQGGMYNCGPSRAIRSEAGVWIGAPGLTLSDGDDPHRPCVSSGDQVRHAVEPALSAPPSVISAATCNGTRRHNGLRLCRERLTGRDLHPDIGRSDRYPGGRSSNAVAAACDYPSRAAGTVASLTCNSPTGHT